MSQATFDGILEEIESLADEEQADLVEVVRRRLAQRGRQRVIDEIRQAKAEFTRGEARPTRVSDLMHEIES